MHASVPDGLAGRVIAVTGSSRGIGHAIAEQLARSGARVIAGARNAQAFSVEGIEALSLDVCDEASVRVFAEQAIRAGADSVVNNAGIGVFGPIESTAVDDYRAVFDTNVLGTLLIAKHFMPAFRRRGHAGLSSHLVCVTSDVSTRSFAGGAVYAASKHAQRAITQTVAREGEAFGLRVTEVRPGMTDTHFNSQTPGQPERAGHLRPQDVAQAVLFALSAPQHVRVDEVVVHPVAQGVEY